MTQSELDAAVAYKDKLKADCIDQLRRRGAAVPGGDPVFEGIACEDAERASATSW